MSSRVSPVSGESQHPSSQVPEKASILSSLPAYRGHPVIKCWDVTPCVHGGPASLAFQPVVTASHVGIVDAEGEGLKGRTTLGVLPLRYRAECGFSPYPWKAKGKEPIGHKRGDSSVLDNSPGLWSKSLSSLFLTQVLAPVAEKLTVFGMCLMTPPLVAPMGVITGGAWTSPRAGTPLEKSSHRSFQFCVSLRDPNPCLPRVSIFQSSVGER